MKFNIAVLGYDLAATVLGKNIKNIGITMKVFLSWSGHISHKIAIVFRDWFPSVIQSIIPYVSSEDIDKGARWSTDIAKELENSTFGILCVTKENINAPWLTFEAGALSKTIDKSLVCPFLFDIKRSEVDGPILQFQSTIFEKEDIKKLLKTMNAACGEEALTDQRLEKAFEVWYPTLELELGKLNEIKEEGNDNKDKLKDSHHKSSEILEEILELSRINQKLLRNPDSSFIESVLTIKKMLEEQSNRIEYLFSHSDLRNSRRIHPMVFEDIYHFTRNKYNTLLILLGLFRNDFPWIYDIGKELIQVLKSRKTTDEKHNAIEEFRKTVEYTFESPSMRELYPQNKDSKLMQRELSRMMQSFLESFHSEIV